MTLQIQNIFERFTTVGTWRQSPWLIVGKGPSFSTIQNYCLSDYRILTLNDSIREFDHAEIAHFIDFDAFKRCANDLHRADAIVLPWFPHFDNKPGPSLADLLPHEPMLQSLLSEGRLYWYDLSTSRMRHGDFPVVSARHFSAEAALDMLATAGVRCIRSLGVDGGSAYSKEFSDLSDVSLLANGRQSFDQQFESFAHVISKTNVDYSPLDMESPIRVFVAATASEALPVKVLEYSIRQHASATVVVMPLYETGIPIPRPRSHENQPRTPFSFQRFTIPQACDYRGRAIYLDSDMLVFKDIVELWRHPLGDSDVASAYSMSSSGRKPQYSVMLMNCSSLNWDIDEIVASLDSGDLSYEQLMYDFVLARTKPSIEPCWNSLESCKAGKTALLHYTDMHIQPWVSHLNPLGYLWVRALRDAIRDGFITRSFLEAEVLKGHVRPSLLYQIDNEIDDSFLLPKSVIQGDALYSPPFTRLLKHNISPWKNSLMRLRALFRERFRKTPFFIIYRRLSKFL